jgi:hypothetical protein
MSAVDGPDVSLPPSASNSINHRTAKLPTRGLIYIILAVEGVDLNDTA